MSSAVPVAWRIARTGLGWRIRGFRLLFACLFLGVAALAAIGSLQAAIEGEFAGRGRELLGGDIELTASGRVANAAELVRLRALGSLSASAKLQATAIAANGAIVPVQLKAVDAHWPLGPARLRLDDGRAVGAPPAGMVWASRTLAARIGGVGTGVRLGEGRYRIAGVFAEDPERIGEGFALGAPAIVALPGLDATGLLAPGSLFRMRYRVLLPPRADPAAATRAFVAAFPAGGWQAKTRDEAAPGASRFTRRLGQFLTLVGLAALAVAGVGVANGVGSYMASRRGEIAVLKVLGADGGFVARVFALRVAAVALAGVAAGLTAGVLLVPLVEALAGPAIPVAPRLTFAPAALAAAAAEGLLIAVAAVAPPLLLGARTRPARLLREGVETPRPDVRALWPTAAALALLVVVALVRQDDPALAGGLLGGVAALLAVLAGAGALLRRVAAAVPRPRRTLPRLALANLHRPSARTVTLTVALGLGLTLFVLVAGVATSLDANIRRTVPARAPALVALDVPEPQLPAFRAAVLRVAPAARIAAVPLLRGTITGYRDVRVDALTTIPKGAWALQGERGLTYAERPPEGSTLTAGRWWPPGYAGPPLVSVDERLAQALDLRLGDPLTVSLLGVERTARIASLRRIDWDTLGFNFVLVFSPNTLAGAPHNLAATVELPPARAPAALAAIAAGFPSTSVIEVGDILRQLAAVVGQVAAAVAAAAGVTVLAGLAVLAGAIAAAREARTYDAVVLRVLGASRAQLLALQALEWLLLATLVAALALVLGLGGAWAVVTQVFDFAWLPDARAIAGTLAAGLGLTLLAGVLGNLRTLSARPAQALRQL